MPLWLVGVRATAQLAKIIHFYFAICYTFGMRKIAYSKDAAKALKRIPANEAKRIRGKIEQYAADPESLANNVITMKGKPGYFRLRVGDWRIIFGDDGTVISIVRIAPRGNVYE